MPAHRDWEAVEAAVLATMATEPERSWLLSEIVTSVQSRMRLSPYAVGIATKLIGAGLEIINPARPPQIVPIGTNALAAHGPQCAPRRNAVAGGGGPGDALPRGDGRARAAGLGADCAYSGAIGDVDARKRAALIKKWSSYVARCRSADHLEIPVNRDGVQIQSRAQKGKHGEAEGVTK